MNSPTDMLEFATALFGGRAEAEYWFRRPVMALDRQILVDLMETAEGAELVWTTLRRMDYGVYL